MGEEGLERHAIHSTLITNYGVVDNEYTGELQSIITGEAFPEYTLSILRRCTRRDNRVR